MKKSRLRPGTKVEGRPSAVDGDRGLGGQGGCANGAHAAGDVDDVVRTEASAPVVDGGEAGADGLAAGELDGVALAIGETDRFDALVAMQGPGEAGGGILAAGEQDEGGIGRRFGHGRIIGLCS